MKLSKFWIIMISVVLSLALVVTVLGFIPLKNAPDLAASDDMTSIEIFTGGISQLHLNNTDTAENFKKITTAYNKTRYFSVLRGILVGKVNGMQLTPDNEEEGDDNRYSESDIKALAGDNLTYMIIFKYDALQTMTIRDETFTFNRAKILFKDSENDIGEFRIALYDTNQFFVAPEGPGDDSYSIRYINAKGKCTILVNAVDDILGQ